MKSEAPKLPTPKKQSLSQTDAYKPDLQKGKSILGRPQEETL